MNVTKTSIYDKCTIASNGNTSPETLAILATDGDISILWNVANNPNTPIETLAVLATDKNYTVRLSVSYNPNATEEICLMINAYEKFNHLVLK
jgi:hypothetical protein